MIRVIVLGLGYVGTTLITGVEKIKQGLLDLKGIPLKNDIKYKVEEIEFVATYDVDASKIGKTAYDVAKMYYNDVPTSLSKITVRKGVHLNSLRGMPIKAEGLDDELSLEECVNKLLKEWEELKPDVVVNICTTEQFKPFNDVKELKRAITNDEKNRVTATQLYAYTAILYSGTNEPLAFINGIPTAIANDKAFIELAKENSTVILGDDGATGATPLTADILEHLAERNRKVRSIAQFNIGGNMDFLALTDLGRNESKAFTKSRIVEDILGYDVPHYIRPTGYLKPLGDRKFVAMHIEYESFNGAVDELYIIMRINDSPAMAGMLVDLIRLAKIALERKEYGTVYPVNAFYMKNPGPPGRKCVSKIIAYQMLLEWLDKYLETKKSLF